MEKLDITLAHIKHLIDDDVIKAIAKCANWEALHDCASIYPIEISHLNDPEDELVQLILSKADEHLSERTAEQFKSAWQQLAHQEQLLIALRTFEEA